MLYLVLLRWPHQLPSPVLLWFLLPAFSDDFVQDALCAFHREVAHAAGAGKGEWRVTNCDPNPAYADNRVFLSLRLSGPLYRIRISISMEECVE